MAIFLRELFGLAAEAAIDLTKISNRLAGLALGFDDKISDEGEKLCVATINEIERTWTGEDIEPVDLDLVNYITGGKTRFYISSDRSNKTITLGDQENVSLSYALLLSHSDFGSSKQRKIIANVLNELSHVGYTFRFDVSDSDAGNAYENKKVVSITAISKIDGKQVNLNEVFVKYGVCKYSNLGNNFYGGVSQHRMKELSLEAVREKRGPSWSEEEYIKASADLDKKLKPFQNFEYSLKKNSKIESNKPLEEEFERDGRDMFKIGDVWLRIPPTHITVSQMRNSYTAPLIGMEAKPLSTPVNRTIIKLNVVFTGNQVYDDMVRILTQFRYCPINILQSKDLFNRLAGSESYLSKHYSQHYYIPVTMDQYTLFNVDGHPGTVSAVFEFSLFNYNVYVPDNPKGLEYFKHDDAAALILAAFKQFPDSFNDKTFEMNEASLKETTPTETTWRLEEASHPYNANIEDRLALIREAQGPNDLYDMENSTFQIWKVDMDRYFSATRGVPNELINVDTEANMKEFMDTCVYSNQLFSEIAHSISITYNNIFAHQPLLSQSQPVAQYVGPGDTVVSVNFKGVNMDLSSDKDGTTNDQKLMGSLLKSWSETYGTSEYGFFDDRYFIRATLLNLADVNIVSIQNTLCTSVESKPGLFDVNVLFSRSMFEYNVRSNPISQFDPYFGLTRMTSLYQDNPKFHKLADAVTEKQLAAFSALDNRMKSGLSINGINSGLRLVLNDVFSYIKSHKDTYYKDEINLSDLSAGSTTKLVSKVEVEKSYNYTNLSNKKRRYFIKITNQKGQFLDEVSNCLVILNTGIKGTNYTVSKWANTSGSDVYKNNGGTIYVDVEALAGYDISAVREVTATCTWVFARTKKVEITNEDIYKNLKVVMTSESYNTLPTDTNTSAEEKAKYSAIGTLMNQINAAKNENKVIFGITPGTLIANENGVEKDLWDNQEFMAAFFEMFCASIGNGRNSNAYNGAFNAEERKKFVKSILNKDVSTASGAASSSKSNHYHIVTKNGVLVEFVNPLYKEFKHPDTVGVKLRESSDAMLKKIDEIIKLEAGDKIKSRAWQIDPKDPSKWHKMILVTPKQADAKDEVTSGIVKNELEKPENKNAISELEKDAKERSYSKPFSAHRYYPFIDGFVGWSPLTSYSSSMGGWFVCESDEETMNKVYRIKETARKAIPWNKDYKNFDPKRTNSAAIKATIPGLLDHIDVTDPLSPMAAIVRPKMLRDISAARQETSNGASIIPAIQFLKKKGTILFGEDATKEPETLNQYFNTVQDWLMYTDGESEKNQVDYITPDGKKVKATLKAEALETDSEHNMNKSMLIKDQLSYLSSRDIDRTKKCVQTNSTFNYDTASTTTMMLDYSKKFNTSVITNKNQATPLGQVNGVTLAEAGINVLGYSMNMNDQVLKTSTNSMMINGAYSCLATGGFVRQGSLHDEKGNPVDDAEYNAIPENVKSRGSNVTGDKLANIMTHSYIEGLLPTRGAQNAFPTYKMYIIKSDTSDYKFSSLDDYWDYRLVQDLMVIRDKNSPVHMLKARVVVDPRYITIAPDYRYRTGVENRLHSVEENHVNTPMGMRDTYADAAVFYKDKAPLRAGMRICIKLGYHSDPRYLDTVFIGTITQLSGSLDSGSYELAAEGDGRELRVPAVNFSEKFTGENYTDIINAILRVNPNVIHFGKVYGSFLRRLSYGHKNLAQIGMLGLSAVGAFGAGVAGVATTGGAAAYAGRKLFTFSSPSLIKNTLSFMGKGGVVAGGAVAAGLIAAKSIPFAAGQFQQAAQWFNPAFDELIARRMVESDWYQDTYGRTSNTLSLYGDRFLPVLGELPGLLKGNIFNANKQSYQLAKHFYQTFKHGNNPIDDNIFAIDIWNGISKKATLNITNKKSIWDVLQSVRRMYPNYALDVRPYGSRSTIFLGPIGFNYWRTDDPVQAILPQINMMEGIEGNAGLLADSVRKGLDECSVVQNNLGDTEVSLKAKMKNSLGLTRAPFIPFQKHHLITSEEDIIMNGLKPTPERGWNAVIVTYGEDPNNIDPKKMIEFVADTDIYPEAIIKRNIHVDFTTSPECATRYALGYLKEGVERLYGGTIILKGNPKIEPYDKVYISDTVNKMYGWVQVETVIHKFDQEMGFTTHIVPNMVCEINNNAYLTTQNIVMSTLYDRYWKNGGWASLGANFAVGSAVGFGAELAGIGASLPFMAGVFLYQAITMYSDFKEAWKNGKRFTEEIKNTGRSNEFVNAEKTMIQDIISASVKQDAVLKGIKYGWVIGYLKQRGVFKFIRTKGSSKELVKDSFDNFAKKIERKLANAGDVLKTNFGETSELKQARNRLKALRSVEAELEKLQRGNITTDTTELDQESLKEANREWNEKFKEYKKHVDGGKVEEANKALEELKAIEESHISSPTERIITEKFQGLASEIKSTRAAYAEDSGIISKGLKGITGTATKGFEGATNMAKNIFKSGALAWMSFGALEFLPNLGYSFAVKAVTKNNVMLVSPIYWRESYLMPSLDGYMANDTFMHINDMLVNVHNTIDEAVDAMNNYLPQVFPIDSELKTVDMMEGVQTVEAATIEDFGKAGELARCIVTNCGLSEIPSTLNSTAPVHTNMWNSLFKYIKDYAFVTDKSGKQRADTTVVMLALIYNESRFKVSAVGPLKNSPAYGIGQIVTKSDGGNFDNVLNRNLSLILPYVEDRIKAYAKQGHYADLLLAKYATAGNISHYMHYNIKSMSDILQYKWNAIYDKLLKDPNGRLAKARAKSKEADIIDAILLYGAYNGLSSNFIEAMNSGTFIRDDGTVVRNHPNKAVFEKYSSQEAIWKKDGFLETYLAMRSALIKCRDNQIREKQKEASENASRIKEAQKVIDNTAKAIKQRVADVAYSWLNRKFTTSNATRKNPKRPRDIVNNILDCSAFVGTVVDDATLKYRGGGNENPVIQGWMDLVGGKQTGYSDSKTMATKGKLVSIDEAQPGDIVFYKKNGIVTHVEVFYGKQGPFYISIGTSDSRGSIDSHDINAHPAGFSSYEIRSYFNY